MNSLERRAVAGLSLLYVFRMLGLFMLLPVLSLEVSAYSGATPALMGLALGIYGLTQAGLQIPLGMSSDRLGRKPVIVAGLLVFTAGCVVAAEAETITEVIIGRALQGCGAIASTEMAMAADLTREENRSKAMASIGGSIALSFMLAMVLGPVVVSYWELAGVFWLTAILSLLGIVICLWAIPTPERSGGGMRETLTMPDLLGHTLRQRELLRHDFGVFVLHCILMAVFTVAPVLLAGSGLPLKEHWLLYLLLLVLSFAAAVPLIILAERRRKMKSAFLITLSILLSGLLILFVARSITLLCVGLFLFFLAFNWLEATLPSLVSKLSPAGAKGTAMGVYSTSQFLGAFVGGSMGGVLITWSGAEAVFAACALLALVWIVVVGKMPQPRHLKRLIVKLSPAMVSSAAEELKAISGVEDIVVVESEAIAYLRVDDVELDKDMLARFTS